MSFHCPPGLKSFCREISHSVVFNSLDPMECSPPGSSVQGILRKQVAIPFSRRIFLTHRSNPSLLHCRQILYHLSHYGSPNSVVQSLSRVRLFVSPRTAARQASLSFTISQSLLKLMPIESVMPSNHLILCRLLLLLPSVFPSIRVFSNE